MTTGYTSYNITYYIPFNYQAFWAKMIKTTSMNNDFLCSMQCIYSWIVNYFLLGSFCSQGQRVYSEHYDENKIK